MDAGRHSSLEAAQLMDHDSGHSGREFHYVTNTKQSRTNKNNLKKNIPVIIFLIILLYDVLNLIMVSHLVTFYENFDAC